MDSRINDIIGRGERAFSARSSLMSLWQESAENFYPKRANFTKNHDTTQSYADNLTTSYPLIVARDLANYVSTMLRPQKENWFSITVEDDDDIDHDGRAWLEKATHIMKKFMFRRESGFVRASKEGDKDFTVFGQCVKSIQENENYDGLYYCTWHLKDCVWFENSMRQINEIHRKWYPTASGLIKTFPKTVHNKVREIAIKEPHQRITCVHIMLETQNYDSVKTIKQPYASLYIDCENKQVMEETGSNIFKYIIPRWETVSDSQYSYSPAVLSALPDARLLQAMTLTLLQAGEKSVDPPMIATVDAIRGDFNIYASGVTWVDSAHSKVNDVLQTLQVDKSGLQFGLTIIDQMKVSISDSFFLNKLFLPPTGQKMTAYEVSQRMQEYVRNALPLFEPIEEEDNAAVCEKTFEILMKKGAFGDVQNMPNSISGRDVKFKFVNPLTDAKGMEKAEKLTRAQQMIMQAAQFDSNSPAILNTKRALRDTLHGIQIESDWLVSEQEYDDAVEQAQQQQAQAMQMQQIQQASMTAQAVGDGGQAVKEMLGGLENAA